MGHDSEQRTDSEEVRNASCVFLSFPCAGMVRNAAHPRMLEQVTRAGFLRNFISRKHLAIVKTVEDDEKGEYRLDAAG
eukprot:scaffold8108_cov267-Pinguiococcus_pyrenoidosus.AAC.7